MFFARLQYARLPKDEDVGTADNYNADHRDWRRRLAGFPCGIALTMSILMNVLLLALLYSRRHPSEIALVPSFPQTLYSPAQTAVKYEIKTFESSFDGNSIYTGYPTSTIDKHWKELYRVGNSRISKEEAALLPNKTIAANPGADDYLVVISVFHDLHCLDRLRKSLWYFYDDEWNSTYNPFTVQRPDTFDAKGLNGIIHLDHCINIIRQSLQCFSDVTPYVFQWSEEAQAVHAYANVVHTCRNFDGVREWALERTYTDSWDGVDHRDEQGACRSGDSGDCLGL
ncbi:hypothetical protein N7523_005998 [Penicillium sp. IBT 18751x]|nr:hypothetical protein N7523_005998 [Penicillium sp. IBT 18751x]